VCVPSHGLPQAILPFVGAPEGPHQVAIRRCSQSGAPIDACQTLKRPPQPARPDGPRGQTQGVAVGLLGQPVPTAGGGYPTGAADGGLARK